MSQAEAAERHDERPACTVAIQCSERDYRRRKASVVAPTFDACSNPECYPDDGPDADEEVVVARGRASKKMHAPRDS